MIKKFMHISCFSLYNFDISQQTEMVQVEFEEGLVSTSYYGTDIHAQQKLIAWLYGNN